MSKTEKQNSVASDDTMQDVPDTEQDSQADSAPAPEEQPSQVTEEKALDLPDEGMEEATSEDDMDVSGEVTGILSIVKALEEQIDTAFNLKDALETELNETRQKLSEELAARAEGVAKAKLLEERDAEARQLRQDMSSAEKERDGFADQLETTLQQLQAVTEERNSLSEKVSATEVRAAEFEGEKIALDAKVKDLNAMIVDIDSLNAQLGEATKARTELSEQVQNLSSSLESANVSKDTIEASLDGANQTVNSLNADVESLRDELSDAQKQLAALGLQLEQQQTENKDLVETKEHLESEIEATNLSMGTARKELDAFKMAFRDIRSEASRTSRRVSERYFKPDEQ